MLRRLLLLASIGLAAGGPPALGAMVPFTSPSGNIDCFISTGPPRIVDCLVQKAQWAAPKRKPASCPLAWFPTEVIMQGRAIRVGSCRGDIGPMCLPAGYNAPRCRVLRYGRSITAGGVRCTSARNGITCRLANGRGKGFLVAREGYRMFR